jgi:hypothetical protein
MENEYKVTGSKIFKLMAKHTLKDEYVKAVIKYIREQTVSGYTLFELNDFRFILNMAIITTAISDLVIWDKTNQSTETALGMNGSYLVKFNEKGIRLSNVEIENITYIRTR